MGPVVVIPEGVAVWGTITRVFSENKADGVVATTISVAATAVLSGTMAVMFSATDSDSAPKTMTVEVSAVNSPSKSSRKFFIRSPSLYFFFIQTEREENAERGGIPWIAFNPDSSFMGFCQGFGN